MWIDFIKTQKTNWLNGGFIGLAICLIMFFLMLIMGNIFIVLFFSPGGVILSLLASWGVNLFPRDIYGYDLSFYVILFIVNGLFFFSMGGLIGSTIRIKNKI